MTIDGRPSATNRPATFSGHVVDFGGVLASVIAQLWLLATGIVMLRQRTGSVKAS